MKKLILTLLLSVSFVLSSFGQRNYAQELIVLLQQGRCFEAMEFDRQYADKLPANDRALDLFYKAHMAMFFNQPDSAAIYLENILTAYELKTGPAISIYYGKLLMIYEAQQRFNVAMGLCDQYLRYLKRNPFDMDGTFIHNETKTIEDVKQAFVHKNAEARIKVVRDTSGREDATRISDSPYLRFNGKFNNLTEETWFDTGVSTYFMMTRRAADKIGTKLVNRSKDSILNIKGVLKRARVEVVDSISIGNVRLFNIPVVIFDERFVPFIPDSLNVKPKASTEKNIGDRQISKLAVDTLNEDFYAHRDLLAYAYYMKYMSAEPTDSIKALSYLSKASQFSPATSKERRHRGSYDSYFLNSKESYRGEFIQKLIEKGESEQALGILVDHINANPEQMTELQQSYMKNVKGGDFSAFITNKVVKRWPAAPDFLLTDVNGVKHTLKDYKGKWLVLDFWGTWCPPCRTELPAVNKFYEELSAGKYSGIRFLSVACSDNESRVKEFLKVKRYSIPAAMSDQKVEKNYSIDGYPSKILVSPDGRMIALRYGKDWEAIVKAFNEVYKAPGDESGMSL